MTGLAFIGKKILCFARARIYRSSIAAALCLVYTIPPSFAQDLPAGRQDPQFILGQDSIIHGVAIDRSQETITRQQMAISENCGWVKKHATAMPLIGSEGASIDPQLSSTRGLIVLEGLPSQANPKILNTVLLNPYKNYPTFIPGETAMQPSPRYPLAITFAAVLAGQGDLVLRQGDTVIVHADNQLFSYSLPSMTLPSEGVVRFYLGTDDTLYYDTGLTHPVHAGACGSKPK